jgi:transcriptional regulator with AAA-type ATPase domain/tetratricopeptide (TPR) repeat protein
MVSPVEMLGESPGIVAIREALSRLLSRQSDARRVAPILIRGETGTGKGLLARGIHAAGPRADGPFVDLNCAAIPETLLESELFGFEKGAFTDARQAKPGLFQTAHRGTLFLDEIGLLPEALQSKLLTALEERAVRRLGSTRTEPVDVWILTATSADLTAAMRERRFREDLYHRLAVVTLWLPPLRERGADIVLLAEHFLARACAEYGLAEKRLTPDARAALLGYPWPGNIRELGNVMERVALLSDGASVSGSMLGLPGIVVAEARSAARPEPAPRAGGETDREQLLDALRETNWNISRAASRLGLSRNTLRYRIEKYGLRAGTAPEPAPVAAAAPAASPAAPVAEPVGSSAVMPRRDSVAAGLRWERRRLVFLRAILVPAAGQTAAVHLGRALEVLVEKVKTFGGRVEELGATGIVAAFGLAPGEDAPGRAAHAALAILKGAERVHAGDPDRPAVRIGLHADQPMVGRLGGVAEVDADDARTAYAALDAVVAGGDPDTIRVTPVTAALLGRRFGLVPVGAREAYRLVGREGSWLGGRLARFVGRQHELELLRSRLATAIAGHGQVVGLGGEIGIGKSRLLFEFRKSLAGERVAYLEGRCTSFGSSIPYFPVVDVVRMGCRIGESDTSETIVAKVRAGLQLLGVDPDEAAPYFHLLLGVKEGTERLATLSPEAIQARTFEILRQTSLKSSRRRPLILAVEDVHWLDSASDAYLAGLVESLPGAPILLVVTYRAEERPRWLDRSYTTHMALAPLSVEDSLTVVHSVDRAAHIPDPLMREILTKAEGNPFFLEELARAVAEHHDPGVTPPVPDTVQEVLQARIDRLPEECRRLLQTVAVLGRRVAARLVDTVWDGTTPLSGLLRELSRLEFLYEEVGGDEPVYVFKHGMTRDVARASVPTARRVALHTAAARMLETAYADRLDEIGAPLAYHYSKARVPDKAVHYLARLAERAAGSYAHAEAVTTLNEALVHAEGLPGDARDRRILDLTLRQAHSLSLLGRFPEALERLAAEEPRLERLGDPAVAAPFYFWRGHTYSYLGDEEQAARNAERALELAARCGDDATTGKALFLLAQESSWSGQPRQVIEHAERAVECLERAGERWWLGMAHWIIGVHHIVLGRFQAAAAAEARALAVGEAIGDPRLQSYATWTAGWILALTGDAEAGIAACQRGLDGSPDPVNSAVVRGHLGYAYLEHGDVERAIAELEQSVAQLTRFGFRRLEGRFLTFLGEAYLQAGRLDEARELVGRGLHIMREARYWYGLGWAQLALGRVELARGELAEAAASLDEALGSFRMIGAAYMAERTRLALAELAAARGDRAAAGRLLEEASRGFVTLEIDRYAERARTLASRLGVALAKETRA